MQHEPVSQLIRVNGASPPDVVLGDIDLGAWDCWAQDDDLSVGAFATLRHLAPVSFWTEAVQPGFESGRGQWGAFRLGVAETSPPQWRKQKIISLSVAAWQGNHPTPRHEHAAAFS